MYIHFVYRVHANSSISSTRQCNGAEVSLTERRDISNILLKRREILSEEKKLPDRFFSKTFCALNSSGQKEFASIGGAHFCQLVVKPWRAKSFTEQSTRLYLHRTKTISHRQFPDNPRNGIEEIQSILTSSPRFIDVLAIIRTTEKLSS